MNLSHAKAWMSQNLKGKESPEELAYAYMCDVGLSPDNNPDIFIQLTTISTQVFYQDQYNLEMVLSDLERVRQEMEEREEEERAMEDHDRDSEELDQDQDDEEETCPDCGGFIDECVCDDEEEYLYDDEDEEEEDFDAE